jgi:putative SOS response-associated peptidase YedK
MHLTFSLQHHALSTSPEDQLLSIHPSTSKNENEVGPAKEYFIRVMQHEHIWRAGITDAWSTHSSPKVSTFVVHDAHQNFAPQLNSTD